MTEANRRTPEAILAAHRQTIAENRRLAAQVLRYLAVVLVAVAGTVFGLMVLSYLASGDSRYDRDWPGRYWFAVLPLLVAAVGLKATGDKVNSQTPRDESARSPQDRKLDQVPEAT